MIALTVSLAMMNTGKESFPGRSVVFDIIESYYPFTLYALYKGGPYLLLGFSFVILFHLDSPSSHQKYQLVQEITVNPATRLLKL